MSLNSTIAELMLEKGRAQAQGALGSGQAWSGALSNIGQSIGGAIQQATDPRRQLEQQQLTDLKAMDTAFTQPGGRDAILNALPGHIRPTVMKQFQEADTSAATMQEAQLKAEAATDEYVNGLAETIKAHNYDPVAAQLSISHAKTAFKNN